MGKILLVDDDKDMLTLSSMWLKKTGHEVVSVTSGKEALDYLKTDKPDLIILDYAMPEMDGPAVFKAIMTDDETKNIPVLFRTGMDDDVLSDLAPAGIVSKSEGKQALMTAVSGILG